MIRRYGVLIIGCAVLLVSTAPVAAASDRAPVGPGHYGRISAVSVQQLIKQAAASDAAAMTAAQTARADGRAGIGFLFRPIRPHVDPHELPFSPDTVGRQQLPPGRDGEPKQSCALNPMQPRCR